MYKQRVFYKEINLNNEHAKDEFDKYRDLFHSQKPIGVDGFYFLITSLDIDNDKCIVKGFQSMPPVVVA